MIGEIVIFRQQAGQDTDPWKWEASTVRATGAPYYGLKRDFRVHCRKGKVKRSLVGALS